MPEFDGWALNPLDHRTALNHPDRLSSHTAWAGHIPFAKFLVSLLRPSTIVELGTYYGDSYCAFCEAVSELELPTKCYAVDTWRGDPQTGNYGDEVLEELRSYHDPRYGHFSTLLQATFDEAAMGFADGEIDLLHIDGFHTYEAAKHDFETWLPKMSDRGVVLMHDTNVREKDFGVRRVLDEIGEQHATFEFLHGHGLGVVFVGTALNGIASSFSEARENASVLRSYFHALGIGVERRREVLAATTQARDAQEEARRIERLREELAEDNQELRFLLADRTNALARTQQDLKITASRLEHLRQEHDSLAGSLQFAVFKRLWRVTSKLAPRSSARHRILVTAVRAARYLVKNGPVAFLKASVQLARTKKLPSPAAIPPAWQDQYELWIETVGQAPHIHEPELGLVVAGNAHASAPMTTVPRDPLTPIATSTDAGVLNEAVARATADWLLIVDEPSVMKPDAPGWLRAAIRTQPDASIVYGDEDRVDSSGEFTRPFFKPGWSPDLFLSRNYLGGVFAIKRDLFLSVGGFDPAFPDAMSYELLLRAMATRPRVAHIPRVISTNRLDPEPFHADLRLRQSRKALMRWLDAAAVDAEIQPGASPGDLRVRYRVKGTPSVTIVVPTRDRLDMLRRCITSIKTKTTYTNYKIMVIDNESSEPATLAYLDSFGGDVLPYPGAFNFARMMNVAAGASDSDYLLFLNNDTEVISPGWIEALLEHGQREEVGPVGARLLFPDNKPQHEGIAIGARGFLASNIDFEGYYDLGSCVRDASAVTAACMLVDASKFHEIGGMDERFVMAYNDVDFCLRASKSGYSVVYTPYALLYHHERASRGEAHATTDIEDHDDRLFRRQWGVPGQFHDPYFNRNLDFVGPFAYRVPRRGEV